MPDWDMNGDSSARIRELEDELSTVRAELDRLRALFDNARRREMSVKLGIVFVFIGLFMGFVGNELYRESYPVECEDSDGFHWLAGREWHMGSFTKYTCHIFRSKSADVPPCGSSGRVC